MDIYSYLGKKEEEPEEDEVEEDNSSPTLTTHYVPRRGESRRELNIPPFELKPIKLLKKSIVLYGTSNTGKSTIIRRILYTLKDEAPIIFVFCPTNEENRDYDGIVPDTAIYEDVTLANIEMIYNRQKLSTEVYKTANSQEVLARLFDRIATPRWKQYVDKMIRDKDGLLAAIEEKYSSDPFVQKTKERDLTEYYDKMICKYYKKAIEPHINALMNVRDLDEEERIALKYRNFNPHCIVIFDDCMTDLIKLIKEGEKTGKTVIKDFFFKGRHSNITHIYTLQDDKIDPSIRKNALISGFTDAQVAQTFFSRTANGFDPIMKKIAESAIAKIFSEEGDKRRMRMIYSRQDMNKFQYIESVDPPKFTAGCEAYWQLCEAVHATHSRFNKNNPFYGEFKG